jgi:thiamine pyrophosphate-dependent acetolactate synthase large subunit-like protein
MLPCHVGIIRLDENPREIGKNMPADCAIQADIQAAPAELNDMIEKGTYTGG